MCMSCKGSKTKASSGVRQSAMVRSAGVRKIVSTSKYGSPKVRMSFGSHKR